MKYLFMLLFLFFHFAHHAQTIDTVSIVRTVDSLIKISRDYTAKYQFDKAEEYLSEAEKMTYTNFGKMSVLYGKVCFNYGKFYHNKGSYLEAEMWYLKSRDIREKLFGKNHTDYIGSIYNLGNLYRLLGYYEQAERLLIESKNAAEDVLGKNHPDFASIILSLGQNYSEQGFLEKAEPLFLESKAIVERTFGQMHPDYATNLHNLAGFYASQGNYKKSVDYRLESIKIIENSLGKSNINYCGAIINLGHHFLHQGNYSEAETLYLEAKSIFEEKIKIRLNPHYINLIGSLGHLYKYLGQLTKSELFYEEVIKMFQVELNNRIHPFYFICLNGLADLYVESGNFDKAGKLFQDLIFNSKSILGKESGIYRHNLRYFAKYYMRIKDYENAAIILNETAMLERDAFLRGMYQFSEQELYRMLNTFNFSNVWILSFAYSNFNLENTILKTCYDNSLFYKGFLLNNAIRIRNGVLFDTISSVKFNLLKQTNALLAKEYLKPVSERKNLVELEEKANTIEKELSNLVSNFGNDTKQTTWQEVQRSLKPNEAAIEFVHFKYTDKFLKYTVKDSIMYVAMLIKPGMLQPALIPLFEEKSLDSLLGKHNERKSDYVNQLYSYDDRGAFQKEKSQKSLYDLIWAPLELHLQGAQKIYFSPSGLLHRINLDAIPISETDAIGDRHQLIAMNSTRQLVVPAVFNVTNEDVVLFGGIKYEFDSTITDYSPIIASRSRGEFSFGLVDSTLRGGSWNYLPGTEREIQAIEEVLKVKNFKLHIKRGSSATEESFKRVGQDGNSPRVLHLSTHGYFFPDPTSSTNARMSNNPDSIGTTSEATAKAASSKPEFSENEEPVFKISEHPMLRSGLILAGGNAGWKGQQTLEGREDGVLTAYEISQMNLSNTELVVLSACETGLGDIKGNEGVYGLQRAFKIAGAKYLIMSLWQVPDRETKEFMVSFYKNWLTKKNSIPDAFRKTQREMRERFINPYAWAGFVLVE